MNDNSCRQNQESPWYDRPNRVLYLKEYEKLVVRENEEQIFGDLASFPARSELIAFTEFISEGERCLMFSANCLVGVETVGDYTVFVMPKVKYADFFTMVNYAYDFNIELKDEQVNLDQVYGNLSAIILKYIVMRLREFVATGLKRAFVRREEDLISKIKGKVKLSSYLKKSVSAKKDSTVPCQFHEIQVDCLENQIIRYTVEMAKVAVQSKVYSNPLRQEIIKECNTALQRLGLVSFRRIKIEDFNRIRYVGRFKEYQKPHQLCRLFMELAKLEMKSGTFLFRGFHMDMNVLFEKFVAGVLMKEAALKVITQKKAGFSIGAASKHICLDGWLNEGRVVFDTKYKGVFDTITKEEEATCIETVVKVLNADIYQILAYCNHNKFPGASGILVYPIDFSVNEGYYKVSGFNREIYITSISLQFNYLNGKPVEIGEFVKRFKAIIDNINDSSKTVSATP